MTAMKTPGVYIVEKDAFPNSIVEVATAVPAFIGHTEKADNGGTSISWTPWLEFLLYKTADSGYYLRCIEKFYKAASHGVAFNMLDGARFPDHPLLTGHDREKVVTYCRSICKRVDVADGYLEDDFTVYLRKRTHPGS